jgi:hypothetical protein
MRELIGAKGTINRLQVAVPKKGPISELYYYLLWCRAKFCLLNIQRSPLWGLGVGPTSSPHENCCLETLTAVRMCPEIRPKHHRRSSRCRRRGGRRSQRKRSRSNAHIYYVPECSP